MIHKYQKEERDTDIKHWQQMEMVKSMWLDIFKGKNEMQMWLTIIEHLEKTTENDWLPSILKIYFHNLFCIALHKDHKRIIQVFEKQSFLGFFYNIYALVHFFQNQFLQYMLAKKILKMKQNKI